MLSVCMNVLALIAFSQLKDRDGFVCMCIHIGYMDFIAMNT